MNQSDPRLRPHPNARSTGPVVPLHLCEIARALRAEPHAGNHGHRQIGLIHRGALRLVLFAFDAGGALPEHRAPGRVVIHCINGELAVDAAGARSRLPAGGVLVIDPGVPHAVEALVESDMLLTVCLE